MAAPTEAQRSRQSLATAPSTADGFPAPETRKRSDRSASSGGTDGLPSPDYTSVANPRKGRKVSRACDHCKQRKARCTGTLPCNKCTAKGITCVYDASYSRGRPPTPQPPTSSSRTAPYEYVASTSSGASSEARNAIGSHSESMGPASRASPELGMTEIGGQVFDPTSGMTFLHRAWKRLAKPSRADAPLGTTAQSASSDQHARPPEARPPPNLSEDDMYRLSLPSHEEMRRLMALYFDVCIATYRILHRPSVEEWARSIEFNINHGHAAWRDIGRPKVAIVFACLSVAMAHHEKLEAGAAALAESDRMFGVCMQLLEPQADLPSLHAAQARILQTLYLLTTSRMNKAWYTFGNALQLISALGLHRKTTRQSRLAPGQLNYLQAQLRMRTFWTAYILDKYLGVIFGRPRHYHDEDIDQDFPDRFEDEDITTQGPLREAGADNDGCHTDALIFHAKIAKVIGQISREVYTICPISEAERISAAHRLSKQLDDWKTSLPAYLVAVRPSMLVTSFRRQSIVLKLAYCHAIMHANRLFLLSTLQHGSKGQVDKCLNAAKTVFEVVNSLAHDGPLFRAFWWTQYVTFCALVVSYVWDIQLKRRGTVLTCDAQAAHSRLMDLAIHCQTHMAKATAQNSPSRRYAVILEEFCSEAMGTRRTEGPVAPGDVSQQRVMSGNGMQHELMVDPACFSIPDTLIPGGELRFSLLDEWNTTHWLELDSSAFGPYMNLDSSSLWMSNLDLSGGTLEPTRGDTLDF
ncbi:fungal-specific transcription factor domain-containing protein [Microdochium trichocladiopsis]|uniref:Fungal-specific transcription factor domain-containing protein n=1 Tax=Microdochium trichocladiopsis TaxID=1682393 RepID=A0A9P9BP05_9PEZI|nr:fungal-specific transcription factor domain-containing protein [Microdochium trichocladiopsis]KAH7021403.1 fungal-specific transcription factor domain-containing protein [Microdochium trichocladiopsis]